MSRTFLYDALRYYGVVIIACIVAGVTAALLAILLVPQTYEARSRVIVEVGSEAELDASVGSTFVQGQLPTYVEIAKSAAVFEEAQGRLNTSAPVNELRKAVTFSVPADTTVIDVLAQAPTSGAAQELANAVTDSFVAEFDERTSGSDDGSVELTVLETATVPDQAASPSQPVLLGAGLITGAALGLLLALWLNHRDLHAKSLSQVALVARTGVLGLITGARRPSRRILRRLRSDSGDIQIDYPRLFSRLGLGAANQHTKLLTIAATERSANTGEVAWELGRTVVASGMSCRVVVADPDISNDLHIRQFTGSKNVPTLVDVSAMAPGGVISVASLTAALSHSRQAAVLIFVGGSVSADANVRSFVDLTADLLLVAPVLPRIPELAAASRLAGEADARLLGLLLVDSHRGATVPQHQSASQTVLEGNLT